MKFSFLKESFRLINGSFSFIPGLWAFSRLQQPIISVFGGREVEKNSVYAQKAYQLGVKLAQNKMSVITGGGPGIMEATHCGVVSIYGDKRERDKWTLGIGVKGVDEEFCSHCTRIIFVNYFFIRRWLLTRYSAAYVVFPGGIGTLEELFEVLDLVRHGKLSERPVILIGKDYWKVLLDWYYDTAIKEGLIPPERQATFSVTDDIDEAVALIVKSVKND
ncbi:TIGR00730 family Rossman fold protein [Candidatus Dependentiae bacterium]|nr:MAG: TIGR00730 family Rossman fold protein [Candidatus Dependentiae bacterium]